MPVLPTEYFGGFMFSADWLPVDVGKRARCRTTGGMMALQSRKSLLVLLGVMACTLSVLLLRSVPAGAQSPPAVGSRPAASAHPLPLYGGSAAVLARFVKIYPRLQLPFGT